METKRIISIILTLALLLSVPSSLFATTTNSSNSTNANSTKLLIMPTPTKINSNMSNSNDSYKNTIPAPINLSANLEINTTKQNAEILSDETGAQVRLLQLSKRIDAQIQGGYVIISNLNSTNTSSDVLSRLNEILSQMQEIKENISSFNMNQSADVLANEFVEEKAEAILLTKEFRTIVHKNLKENQIATLRKKYLERKQAILSIKNRMLERLRNRYNAKIAKLELERFGKSNPKLIKEVQEGKIKPRELRKELRSEFKKLSVEKRKLAIQKMRERQKLLEIKQQKRILEIRQRILKKIREHKFNLYKGKLNRKNFSEKARNYMKNHNLSQQQVNNLRKKEVAGIQKLREEYKNYHINHSENISQNMNVSMG